MKPRTRARSVTAFCLLAVFSTWSAAPAAAGKRKPSVESEQKRLKAKKFFKRGEVHYNLGQFEKARKLYSEAYKVLPLAAFLFNIGQCNRMLGNYKMAVFFYAGYLRGGKNVPNRRMVEKLIAETQRLLDAKRKLKPTGRPPVTTMRDSTPTARPAEKPKTAPEPKPVVRVTKKPSKPRLSPRIEKPAPPFVPRVVKKEKRRTPFYKRWWFWTAVGAGAVAAVATGVALAFMPKKQTVLPAGDLDTIDAR